MDTMAVAGVDAITAAAITVAAAIGVVVAGAIVAQVMVAITVAEAMVTLAALTADAQPMLDAVMPGAATVPVLAASTAAAVVDMAAAIAKWFGKFSNRDKPTIQVVGLSAPASTGTLAAGSLCWK